LGFLLLPDGPASGRTIGNRNSPGIFDGLIFRVWADFRPRPAGSASGGLIGLADGATPALPL